MVPHSPILSQKKTWEVINLAPVVRRKKISEPNAEKSFTSTDHQILMTADPIKLSKEEVCFYKQFLNVVEARRDFYKFRRKVVNNIGQ